ncbi:MAG: PDZ domain-containing protein [Bacteroidales bacterium]|nr:PDZ domain-containing protein [Bacteroidales bacterium]
MKKIFIALFIAFFVQKIIIAQEEARLLRFPAIFGNQVVFTYAGDLYTVDISKNELARKLTNHQGYEMFAHFSPDGKHIAFSAQYDGNTEVYVIPSTGGEPKRLTHTATLRRDDVSDRMGPNNIVTSWTPDGQYIIYRSRKNSWNDFVGQLYKVSINGGMSEPLPLSTGGFNSFSPDGKKLAFNRVMREFRTWKYYQGGMADDIRIFDFETKQVENITQHAAQDIFPMWWKNEIYFLSNRDRIMNLFVYDIQTKQTSKVTNFNEYDIKFPSLGDGKIIFENGGFLYVYNIETKELKKLTIYLSNDNLFARQRWIDASKYIQSYDIAPDGSRLLVNARGDIWILPKDKGVTYNITNTSDVHEREAYFSPNGKYVAYLSDESGEYELYIKELFTNKPPIQLTKGNDTYIFSIEWSPDSKKLLFSDKKFFLKYIDIETKQTITVTQSKTWEIRDYTWSPDSRWIAYTDRALNNTMSQIFIYNLTSKTTSAVTNEWYSSYNPVFSQDGKYLFFVSNRDFDPVYSQTEWNHAYVDMAKIYFITLQKEIANPFLPSNNPITLNPDTTKKFTKATNIRIDFDKIQQRIVNLPIDAGSYWNIQSVENKLYYVYRSTKTKDAELKVFDFEKKKEQSLGKYSNYCISANNKYMCIRSENNFYIIDLPQNKIELKDPVALSSMKQLVDVVKEWKQIYDESWRQMRDFLYDPNMHGVDWKAMYNKYLPLAKACKHRNDLTYVIGELIGELNVGHAYVGGGDQLSPDKVYVGLLGAEIIKHYSGYFQITKILKGENWNNDLRSPLTEIGININEGDFIIAINNQSVKNLDDIYKLLINKSNTPIELTVSSKPDETQVRKVVVTPIESEQSLYYYEWVQNNIRKVNEATNGEVGYIHIPDMSVEGLNEFVKYFYPQLNKKGLIIDDRGNGGGNVSPMIIERLKREIAFYGMARNQVEGETRPRQMHLGPKVMLVNQYSASDGDLFPYQFKKYKIGKVIGVRTWGGVVGIRGTLPFIDGGYLNRPEFAHYDAEGKGWIIEGYGVDPDIVIDNDPYKEFMGEDAQLQKAIEIILDELKQNPVEKAPIPPFPDKSK